MPNKLDDSTYRSTIQSCIVDYLRIIKALSLSLMNHASAHEQNTCVRNYGTSRHFWNKVCWTLSGSQPSTKLLTSLRNRSTQNCSNDLPRPSVAGLAQNRTTLQADNERECGNICIRLAFSHHTRYIHRYMQSLHIRCASMNIIHDETRTEQSGLQTAVNFTLLFALSAIFYLLHLRSTTTHFGKRNIYIGKQILHVNT